MTQSLMQRAKALEDLLAQARAEIDPAFIDSAFTCSMDLISAGEHARALRILKSVRPNTDRDEVRLAIALIRAYVGIRDSKQALATADLTLTKFPELRVEDGCDAVELRIARASGLWLSNRPAEAAAALRSERAKLLKHADTPLLSWCLMELSAAEQLLGNYAVARDLAQEAIVSARRTDSTVIEAAASSNLSQLERQRCRWHTAQELSVRAIELLQSLEGNSARIVNARRSLAITLWKRGKLVDALQASNECLRDARSVSADAFVWLAELLRGLVHLHLGDFEEARSDFMLGVTRVQADPGSRAALLTPEFLGDVHLEQGQAAEALKHYDEVWPKAMALVPKGDIVAELRRRRAECYLLLGRNEEAYVAAKEGLDHCRELGDRYEEAATYRVLALSAAAVGKHDEARQHFTQGFAYYDDIETPYEWGKLWMAYGDWLLGSGAGPYEDRAAAREAYVAARDYFSNMGARAKLREAEARLKSLDAEMPAVVPTSDSEAVTGPSSIIRRPQRRPTSQSEVDRRSEGAWHDWYIITRHEPLLNILDRAAKLARSDVPILVTGETGTGKELVASGIHRASRLEGNYIPLNCAAVPKEMIESELFGHVRGAFSGAIAERQGLVEMAAKGTLFLDEVGEMSEAMQAKLLRFLESGEYRRVGEGAHRVAKTRLVAATNVSRERLEKGEGFRNDLFWRLAQGCLEIPALRHRQGDVPLLVDHFLRLESRKMNKLSLTISDAARAELAAYAWPGNVRELVGVMRRAVALAEHTIEPEHLDLTSTREVAVTLTEEMAAAERVKLARAMKEHGDSPTAAARALGIPRTTLLMKLKRYGMR